MPNDAKLGLVFGVGLVVAVAVVFFRKDSVETEPAVAVPTEAVRAAPSNRQPPTHATSGGARGVRRHVVQEGDTLYSLARTYYKNDAKFVDIFQANRGVLQTPDPLTPGTVLVLPNLSEEPAD